MPIYEFVCNECEGQYEALVRISESSDYPSVECPKCQSKGKRKIPSSFAFNFSNPVGTDRWNSDAMGHDYRYKQNAPIVRAERQVAEALSHVGADPYQAATWDDTSFNEGITDVDRETFTL